MPVVSLLVCLIAQAKGNPPRDLGSDPVLAENLLAWYNFDGDFNDARGKLNAKVTKGSPGFGVDRFGQESRAFHSEGGNALSVDGIEIGGGSFTIQFWALNPENWFLGQGARKDYQGLHIGVEKAELRCDYWGSNLAAPLDPAGAWTHWVVTHDIVTRKKSIWRNGRRVAEMEAGAYGGRGPFFIGMHFSGGGFYRGSLDDLAIWKRALSSGEIATLYGNGRGMVYPTKH